MTALRVIESSGSIGSIQVADGAGGFLSGSLIAGSNVTISNNGAGSFTIAATGGSGGAGGETNAEYVLTTATGSLPNAKVIEAGSGISIVTGSNTVTISSTLSSITGREKTTYFVTSSHSALSPLVISGPDFSTVQYDPNKIDVNLNGQLLHTGSLSQVTSGERDYSLSATGSITFGFQLENRDVIDTIISVVGSSGGSGGGENAASYLVLSNTGSLSNERAFVAGTGLTATDAGANGNYTLANSNGNYVFNEYLGQADGSNSLFILDYAPTAAKNVSVFVNGQLQMPATSITSAPFQDYSVTGSNIYFTTASIPPDGSLLMANYTTNEAV